MQTGQYEETHSSIVHDDAPDETSVLRTARITSFASFSSVCSFYNAAGQVQGKIPVPGHCLATAMLTVLRITCTQLDLSCLLLDFCECGVASELPQETTVWSGKFLQICITCR